MRTILLLLWAGQAFLAAAAEPPRKSPPLTIEFVGGPPATLESFRGKVVFLAFIDTGCQHCQAMTRELAPLAREYAPKGVQFLECAFNSGVETAVPEFIRQFQPGFPVGYADRVAVYAFLQRSILDTRPLYVPHVVFLDRAGMIRSDYPGESGFAGQPAANARVELDKLLAEPVRTPASKAPVRKKQPAKK